MRMMKILAFTAAVMLPVGFTVASPGKVKATLDKEAVSVTVDGKLFCKYQFKNRFGKKPYIYPLVGPKSGKSVTAESLRQYPQNNSLWFGCAEVNGVDFWHHQAPKGKLVSQPPVILRDTGERVVFEAVCDWKAGVNKTIMRDYRRIAVSAPDSNIRIIDFNIVWVALDNISIKQNDDALFAMQMTPSLSVKGGGVIASAGGGKDLRSAQRSKSGWVDCSGTLEGVVEGAALMQHPVNRWNPAAWISRDYGFISPSPICRIDGHVLHLQKDEAVRLAYRVVVHTGNAEDAAIARHFKLYAELQPEPVRMYLDYVLSNELPKVAQYKWGTTRRALLNVRDTVQSVAGVPALRAKMEAALIRTLVLSDTTADGRKFICRQLALIGSDDAVVALGRLMEDADPHVADAAVCALSSIGSQKAAEVLLAGLPKVNGTIARESLIEALGRLRCESALSKLVQFARGDDKNMAHTATVAMGRVGGDKVVRVLLALWNGGLQNGDMADAMLTALAESKVDPALSVKVCGVLYDAAADSNRKLAAVRMAAVKYGDTGMLQKVLAGGSELRLDAVTILKELPGEQAGPIIKKLLESAEEGDKAPLLLMAAETDPASCLDDARTAVQSQNQAVRDAAYRVIARSGAVQDVDLLLSHSDSDKGAFKALAELSGTDVSKALITKLSGASPDVQRVLIKIMSERGDSVFATPMLELIGGDNRTVSLAAIKGLKRAGDATTARKMVDLLGDEKLASSYRRAMESSLAGILSRLSGKQNAERFMKENYRRAAPSAKASLLSVMGSLQDPSTLDMVAKAALDSDADISTAAVRSLTRWRDRAAIEPILQVAEQTSNKRNKKLCLNAAARLLRSSKSQDKLRPLYEKGLKLAESDDERKLFEIAKPEKAGK